MRETRRRKKQIKVGIKSAVISEAKLVRGSMKLLKFLKEIFYNFLTPSFNPKV
jgi:hypothetical protein